jgi:hypothetical protein
MERWSDGVLLRRIAPALQYRITSSLGFICSALSLFVTRVGADHTNDAFAAYNFAILAEFLNRRAYLHI